ncbi:hypothetical protein KJ562_00300 [Patescibacteria group bacterium]|nr:hypothetical protein [Patescibacteria group bacterium]MBU4162079.1 hypothetical protein [Patescibacteria group bacterium]
MKPKPNEKRIVQCLRKQGLSYNEILQKVPVTKSSISFWCQGVELTPEQKERLNKKRERNLQRIIILGPKAIAKKRKKEIHKIKIEAKKEIHSLAPYEFKIVGAMLYWAEGSKSGGVEITNSDPKLIKFMVRWLKQVCEAQPERLKARLNIHANQNDKKIKKYWSEITNIPISQFGKSYIKPEGTGHRKNILDNGVIRIRFGSEDLRHRIMTWIKVLYQSL